MSLPYRILATGYPIITLGESYTDAHGMFRRKHIHGWACAEKMGTVTLEVDGVKVTNERKFLRFRLDNGEEFWEFERTDWDHFDACWADDPPCCVAAMAKTRELSK